MMSVTLPVRTSVPMFCLNSDGERHLVRLYEINARIESLMASGRKSFILELIESE